MNKFTIYKNYYTCGWRALYAFNKDVEAIASDPVVVKLPEKCKLFTDGAGCALIEMPHGDIANKILTSHWSDGSAHAYVVDCNQFVIDPLTGKLAPRRYYLEPVDE